MAAADSAVFAYGNCNMPTHFTLTVTYIKLYFNWTLSMRIDFSGSSISMIMFAV